MTDAGREMCWSALLQDPAGEFVVGCCRVGECYCCGRVEGVRVMWEWRSDLVWGQEGRCFEGWGFP